MPPLIYISLLAAFVFFPLAATAQSGGDTPPARWELLESNGGVRWKVDGGAKLPHRDHVEMSGRQVSLIVTYGVDEDGRLVLERKVVWPLLRTLPENTHANVIRDFRRDAEPQITIDGEPIAENPIEFVHAGRLHVKSRANGRVTVERTISPSLREPAVVELVTLKNDGNQPVMVGISPPRREVEQTDPKKSRYGVYELGARAPEAFTTRLAPGQSTIVPFYIYGQKEAEPIGHPLDVAKELDTRKKYVDSLSTKLVLETPDPYLNQMFALAKLRGAESIYATKGGLMHGPGGGRYYAAIWANDQAEYINPFFPFLGDADGNESAVNSFRHFARYMNDEYKPIPSSIISEGDGKWHGRRDRGDMAMIAYGAGRFALARGDRETASQLWPLIEWCLEYCRRQINDQGVVKSNSDELEGRFPAGDANLCTSTLYYDALLSAAMLGKELGKPAAQLEKYREQAAAMRSAIERHFGATVEGFPTYRYYDGNDVLRAWIAIPLTMGIFDRRDGTIDALFSPRLWTPDGLASQAGDKTFWDRATLYALRGVFAAGETRRGLEYLDRYTRRRLVGEHVPYPVEAWPEGNQRHLSAESGLYCRIFTEGLFGIRPTGFTSFDCTPHLPDGWQEMALRKIQAFGREFDLVVARDGEELKISVTEADAPSRIFEVAPGETAAVQFVQPPAGAPPAAAPVRPAVGERTTSATTDRAIKVATANSQLALFVGDDRRLYQLSYGRPQNEIQLPTKAPDRTDEFFPCFGDGQIYEPALQATHADGNTSTDLVYVKHSTSAGDPAVTRIELKDRHYPLFVTLCLKAYREVDVIEQWCEIRHEETGPVTLDRYASSAPLLRGREYWLTQFHGDYKREATLAEERLTPGIKLLDSKIGVRATRFRLPSLFVSLGGPATEEEGEVVGGSLAWSGSFSLALDLNHRNRLRVVCGINPHGSQYQLDEGRTFTTPAMLWTYSREGKGQVSRNFHRWARKHGIRDGERPRPVLLNNWEATHTNFDDDKIVSLFDGAAEIGVELFLLDDGWFGNKHPRDNDRAGLGDWEVNRRKLPRGLSHLADEAKKRGLEFGIWLEPEMVNPQSDLYEAHPDWAIVQPFREPELSRYQLVLDLTRPDALAHARRAIDDTLAPNPGISYVKWDANRYVTQPGSSHLSPARQSHLMVDYNFALYDLMRHMATTYPNVMGMVCAGGGGRAEYGSLKYFHSFWPSDNTDPRSRVMIQWGFGHIFPANTISAHVTRMGRRPLKFACDVALSGAFGVDMDLSKVSAEDRRMLAAATKLYKERLRDVVAQGDLYRLESPYDGPRAALSYVSPDKSRAVLFVYQLKDSDITTIRPHGLDADRDFTVREVNLPTGAPSQLARHETTVDGATLMRDGLVPPCTKEFDSTVIELVAQ